MSTLLQEELYKYGFTAVNLPAAHADYIIKWGREMIPDEHLYHDANGGCGRETEPHITVLYGLTDPVPSKELIELVRKTPPFTVRLTSVTLFENDEYDVVKFDVDSEELVALSNAIREACPNENKYPKYVPHCTVAYVKKGRVPDLAGNYPFEQNPPIPAEFEVNEILFRPGGDSEDPKRVTTRLPLNRYRKESEDPKAFLRSAPKTSFVVALTDYVPFVRNRTRTYYWANSILMLKPKDGTKFNSRAEAEAVAADLIQGGTEAWVEPFGTSTQEAEDPKAALKIHKITTPLRFKYVPVGFYFRTPTYELLRKTDPDPETGANALLTDLDTVRKVAFQPGTWVFPPKWTVDDITSGPDLDAEQTYFEGLEEAEDPKSVMRNISDPSLVLRQLGFTEATPDTYNREHNGLTTRITLWKPRSGSRAVTFTLDTWAKGSHHIWNERWHPEKEQLRSFIERHERMTREAYQLAEAEDPKNVLKLAKLASGLFVVTRLTDAYGEPLNVPHYLKAYGQPPNRSAVWYPDLTAATRYRSEKDAWREIGDIFGDAYNDAVSLTPVGEGEDPKAIFKAAAQAQQWEQVTIRWLDQHGGEHQTSYYDLPLNQAEEELKKNLVINRSPYTIAKVIEVIPKRLSPKRLESRAPFDLLQFPIEASVLASKLLELDHVEKPAVL